jgi:cytochrome b561
LHETVGTAVFVLASFRVLWRLLDMRPDPPEAPRWILLASRLVHGALYLLLFALPITAVSGAWLEGHPMTLLGDIRIGPYAPASHDIGARVASVHGWLGDTVMWLAGVHAAAAIFHHAVLRDGVLLSMIPRWLPLRARAR